MSLIIKIKEEKKEEKKDEKTNQIKYQMQIIY